MLPQKPMGEQTLRPLTIKQIKNCTIPQESTFRVDNADITQVKYWPYAFSNHYYSNAFLLLDYFCWCYS